MKKPNTKRPPSLRRRPVKVLPPAPPAPPAPSHGKRWVYREELLKEWAPTDCYVTIWRWMRDGKFPRPYMVGKHKNAWLASELDEWLKHFPKREYRSKAEVA